MNDYLKAEKHHQVNEHRPGFKFTYGDYEVAVSEGGPYLIEDMPLEQRHALRKEHPIGFYECACIMFFGGVAFGGHVARCDFFHDMNLTDEGRREARLNRAKLTAMQIIDDWNANGFKIDPESVKRKVH